MKAEIELSERLRKACVERGITNPKFVAQDWSGNWYHYVAEPYMCKESWRGTFTSDDEDEILLETETELNNSWRDTLMEFVTPKIEAGKRYWRRDGSISGVIRRISDIAELCFYDEIYSYDNEGYYIPNRRCEYDLIAEYREESITEWAQRHKIVGVDAEAYFVPDIATRDEFMNDQIRPTEP